MAKTVRLSSPVEEICLSADNAIAYRRVLGVEKKNRADAHIGIERELLEPFKELPRGALTDAVNIGLNIVLVQRGML